MRDYNAKIGRWTAKEPLGFIASLNFYSYCNNDPVNFIDVSGKDPVDPDLVKEIVEGIEEILDFMSEKEKYKNYCDEQAIFWDEVIENPPALDDATYLKLKYHKDKLDTFYELVPNPQAIKMVIYELNQMRNLVEPHVKSSEDN